MQIFSPSREGKEIIFEYSHLKSNQFKYKEEENIITNEEETAKSIRKKCRYILNKKWYIYISKNNNTASTITNIYEPTPSKSKSNSPYLLTNYTSSPIFI